MQSQVVGAPFSGAEPKRTITAVSSANLSEAEAEAAGRYVCKPCLSHPDSSTWSVACSIPKRSRSIVLSSVCSRSGSWTSEATTCRQVGKYLAQGKLQCQPESNRAA